MKKGKRDEKDEPSKPEPPWYVQHPAPASSRGHSTSRPHESYEPDPPSVTSVISGRVMTNKRPTEPRHRDIFIPEYAGFRINGKAPPWRAKAEDDLGDALDNFEQVEEEVNPDETATDRALVAEAESAPTERPDQIQANMLSGRRVRLVELPEQQGVVTGWKRMPNGHLYLDVLDDNDHTRSWWIYDTELAPAETAYSQTGISSNETAALQELADHEGWEAPAVTLVPDLDACPQCGVDHELVRHCRVCMCTDDHGCDVGCSWVEEDLCSNCPAEAPVTCVSCHRPESEFGDDEGWVDTYDPSVDVCTTCYATKLQPDWVKGPPAPDHVNPEPKVKAGELADQAQKGTGKLIADAKALKSWQRHELPWLIEQLDLGYGLGARMFKGLSSDQLDIVCAKRPAVAGDRWMAER